MDPRTSWILTALLLALGSSPLASAQQWEWAARVGGSTYDESGGIAVDPDGNVYVTGSFTGTATFGPFTLTSAGSDPLNEDVFLARLDPDGEVVWARRAGGAGSDRALAMAVSADGDIFVAGTFRQTATFGNVVLTATGCADVFLAKYSPAGNVVWARSAGGGGMHCPENGVGGVAVDGSGNAFVSGSFEGTLTVGATVLVSAGVYDAFLAKYSPEGEALWARQAAGTDLVGGAMWR